MRRSAHPKEREEPMSKETIQKIDVDAVVGEIIPVMQQPECHQGGNG